MTSKFRMLTRIISLSITTALAVLTISLHEMFGSFQTVGFYGFANRVRPCSLLKNRSETLKMQFHLEKLAVLAAFAIGGMGAAYAQNTVEQLQPLVETTAPRLMIGEQVALAKW